MEQKEIIRSAILYALEKGETMHNAIISLINAGYNRDDVLAVANEILMQKKGIAKEEKTEKEEKQRIDVKKIGEEKKEKVGKIIEKEREIKLEKKTEEIEEKNKFREAQIEKRDEKIMKGKLEKFEFSKIKFFLPSLILILYYLIILIIKYKNWISLVWIIFGLPCLVINLALIINQKTSKLANEILILINLIAFIGLIIFIIIPNFDVFFEALKVLFIKPKYLFIFPSFILAYLLNLFGLIERLKS